jgi:hypothetical protein
VTIPLPTPIPQASGWALSDWRTLRGTAITDSFGFAVLNTLDVVPDGELWLVDRVVVSSNGALLTTVRLWDSTRGSGTDIVDGTDNPCRFAVAEYPNGLLFRSGSQPIATWSGGDSGQTCFFRAQLRVFRKA